MTFEPIVPNPDIDVHPSPPGLWSRVAIACRWKDAHAMRKRWPHAAVIGPMRTLRGIDELVRNLLHNPQIRLVVLDGPDLTPDEETTKALLAVWDGERDSLQPELRTHIDTVLADVDLIYRDTLIEHFAVDGETGTKFSSNTPREDRSGGRITLPPPPPTAAAPAPHGDPGERVAADTLAELWPMILHRAMRFGRVVPTQYGDTRELLNLVAVIRDPRALNLGPLPHPVLDITWEKAKAYHQRVTSSEIPEGAPYSYGSRMRGTGWSALTATQIALGGAASCLEDRSLRSGPLPDTAAVIAQSIRSALQDWPAPTDQFARLDELLTTKPDTRAAFVTPWRPDEDSGKESGRPCLVGAWFRVEPGEAVLYAKESPTMELRRVPTWGHQVPGCDGPDVHSFSIVREPTLHMTVHFRSHDLFGAYAHNLAGICLWFVETAERHGMEVGTLTCVSMSAHVYVKDWNAADVTIAEHYDTNHEPRWDQRSTWRVELIRAPGWAPLPINVGEKLTTTRMGGTEDVWVVTDEEAPMGSRVLMREDDEDRVVADEEQIRRQRNDPRRPPDHLRAVALTPDGRNVVTTFEASTPEGLRAHIERSGLVTSIGGALWLGAEIDRVARNSG